MKQILVPLIIVLCAESSFAQGTLNFANLYPNLASPVVNAPVYESDGLTKLSGPQFTAELLAGPSIDGLASVASTGFLTGNGAGYFSGGAVTVPGILEGSLAWVQVDVWKTASGSTFSQARASGLPDSWWQSSAFSLMLGGGGVNPNPPALLTGLGTSPVYLNSVPEPATLALVGLGAALALFQFRRRDRSAVSNR